MKIERVFVAGAGAMGSGIAQLLAGSGRQVVMYDLTEEIAAGAKARIVKGLQKQVEKGRLEAEKADEIGAAITPSGNVKDAAGCRLAIEAASENPEVKKQLLGALDEVMDAEAVITSNTSSISITQLASYTKRPGRFAGLHFFNPVHAMKLVEVVRGLATEGDIVTMLKDLAVELGKVPVVCKDSPGFVVNRLMAPQLNEAAYLAYEGVAEPADIDLAMVNGLNHPIGPLALIDLIGVDIEYAIMQVIEETTGDPKYRPCPLLKQMLDAGRLGRKTGRGFFEYEK